MKSDLKNNSINYLEVDLAGDAAKKLSDEAEILSIDLDENLFLGTDLGRVIFSLVSSECVRLNEFFRELPNSLED